LNRSTARKKLTLFLLASAALCAGCTSGAQKPQRPESAKTKQTDGPEQAQYEMGGHISEWPPKYREKIVACEPAIRAVIRALIDRKDETWIEHLAPPEFHVEALAELAKATRTTSAHKKAARIARDGGKEMREKDERRVREGLERTREFLKLFDMKMTRNTEIAMWPSDDPHLFLQPGLKKFKSRWHVILGGNIVEVSFGQKHVFLNIGGLFDVRTYYVGHVNPLGILVLENSGIAVTTLVYPTGYSVWDETMPIPVPPTGIGWGGPSGKGVGFLVRSSYAREDRVPIRLAHFMVLHMILTDYERDELVPLTQAAYGGKQVVVESTHEVFSAWSSRAMTDFPGLRLKELTIERWPEAAPGRVSD